MGSQILGLALRLLSATVFALGLLVPAHAAADDPEAAFQAAQTYTVRVETSVTLPLHSDDALGVYIGTAFLVDLGRGWFMTNAHVASRSLATLRVFRRNGVTAVAHRVYLDPYLDLAILAVEDREFLRGMQAAPLACGEAPPVGHPVGAFGHPWGIPFIGTRGIVAGRNDLYENGVLLTDAPINSGNSGGPLISLRSGEVVGISTSVLTGEGVQNLNFAVMMKYACRVLRLLQEKRNALPLAESLVFLATPANVVQPLLVARNYMGPQHIALQPGDVIEEVVGEDIAIASEAELVHALRGRLTHATIRVRRGGRTVDLTGSLPAAQDPLRRRALFVSGLMIGEARQFDPREVNFGRLATCYVAEGSAGSATGFQKCDTIESIDGTAVLSLDDVHAALRKAQRERREAIVEVKRLVGPKGRSFFSYSGLSLPVDEVRWVTPSP